MNKDKSATAFPVLFHKPDECCGCTACYAACPQGAIVMTPDAEGFLYPQVNTDKCVCCYACLRVCAFKKDRADKEN